MHELVGTDVTVRAAYQDLYHGRALMDERCPNAGIPIWITNEASKSSELQTLFDLQRENGIGTPIYGRFTGRIVKRPESMIDGTIVQIATLELLAAHDLKVLPARRPWHVRPQ
jgi:hypothetical protein